MGLYIYITMTPPQTSMCICQAENMRVCKRKIIHAMLSCQDRNFRERGKKFQWTEDTKLFT